ncbi:MAG: glycosyltransferase [Clostridia bacterium]|nr:glycosyltransferase [Clostridia bacterium]
MCGNQILQEVENKQPTFSIIIPMKNAEQYILNALASIANQKF